MTDLENIFDDWIFLGFDRFTNMKHLKCNNCGCDMFLEFTSFCPNCGVKKKALLMSDLTYCEDKVKERKND